MIVLWQWPKHLQWQRPSKLADKVPIMENVLKKLKELKTKSKNSVSDLMHRLRRESALHHWLPLESYLLPPVPAFYDRKRTLIVPVSASAGNGALTPPWGAIEYTWPQGRVAQLLDLRMHPEAGSIRKKMDDISLPKLKADEKSRLEAELHQNIQEIFESGLAEFNPEKLLPLYNALVPESIFTFYWILNPDSKTWLRASAESPKIQKTHGKPPKKNRPQTAGRRPQNLPNGNLGKWLNRGRKLAAAAGDKRFVQELDTLTGRLDQPNFRLAVVGAFSSGKSTLINRLLKRELLPADHKPTTGAITSISAGKSENARIKRNGSWSDALGLDTFTWEGLKASDLGDEKAPVPKVMLSIKNGWLSDLDLEIIDTPGIDDLVDKRAVSAYGILTHCDGVIMVVNQLGAFSLKGKEFIEQEIIGRNVPARLVTVTNLDRILEKDKPDSVVQEVARRMHEIDESIKVIAVYPDKDSDDNDGIEKLRIEISELVNNGERQVWRKRQAASAIANIVGNVEAMARTKIEACRMDPAGLDEEKRNATWAIEKSKAEWVELEIEIQNRRKSLSGEVKSRIEACRPEIVRDLEYNLSQGGDPVKCWNHALPHFLLKMTDKLSAELEHLIMGRLNRDYEWLKRNAKSNFKVHFPPYIQKAAFLWEGNINMPNTNMDDLHKKRLFTRIGAGAATLLGYAVLFPLVGPLAMIAPLSAVIFSEEILTKKIDEQKKILSDKLEAAVAAVLKDYYKGIESNIKELYQKIIAAIHDEMMSWLEIRQSALNSTPESTEARTLEELTAGCIRLRKEINQYLE
jgi:GTPase SAR1 family protein